MQFTTTLLQLVVLLGAASATPVKRALAGTGYGTFYGSNDCTGSGTVAFAFNNAGCIANQYGKNSLYVQPGNANTGFGRTVSLVWSPGSDCNCQNDCAAIAYNGGDDYCMDLNGHADATSFRFIQQGCASNNC